MKSLLRVDLRRLILTLAVLSASIAMLDALWASWRVQRAQLIDSTLETNRVYALKVAETTAHFLSSAQQQLSYSAATIGNSANDESALQRETARLKSQTGFFNAVLIVDPQGMIRAASPPSLRIEGSLISSPWSQHALTLNDATISQPFVSMAGNLIISMAQPITDEDGRRVGTLFGAIYLNAPSVLQALMGEHYYRDGSLLYVVDQGRHILYHADPKRVGTRELDNVAVEAVVGGAAGSNQIVNSEGVRMLAGFAPVKSTGWGIVAQRPLEATLAPLHGLMQQVIIFALPAALICLILLWWLSKIIAYPLWQLARNVDTDDLGTAQMQVRKIKAWYFEARQLQISVLRSMAQLSARIGTLNNDRNTDPLTALLNRRGCDEQLAKLIAQSRPFAAIMLDLDFFKRVNDTHGHDIGDQVLAELAGRMRKHTRSSDILCRTGGEEFLILSPDSNLSKGGQLAERLREAVAQSGFGLAGSLTISAGVAHWPYSDPDPAEVLRRADKALYAAKEAGRNRVKLDDTRPAPTDPA